MEILIGVLGYMFVGAMLHGFMFGSSGDMKSLMGYMVMWPFILTSLGVTKIKMWLTKR